MQSQMLYSVARVFVLASTFAFSAGGITSSSAATLSLTDVRPTTLGTEQGAAVDTATGRFYSVPGYSEGTGATAIYEYANAATFEANTALRTIGIPNPPIAWDGTYFGARDGSLYDGTLSSVNPNIDIRQLSVTGATASETGRQPVVGMTTTSSFNWGGLTYGNVLNNGSYLSVIGSMPPGSLPAGSAWQISRFDYNLNPLGNTAPFLVSGPGFGFQIGDYVFLGSSFNSGQVSQRVHAITGVSEAVDFFLDSPGLGTYQPGDYYINNAFYDPLGDTLYLSNNGRFEKLASASSAFGVTVAAPIPEPSTYALMLAGLGMVGFIAHRRRNMRGPL